MFSRIFPLAAFAACLLAIAACSDSPAPPATSTALAAHTPTAAPSPTHAPTPAPTATPTARHTPHYEFEETFPPGFRPSQITLGDGYICGLDEDGRAVCIEGVADAREMVYQSAKFSAISSGKLHVCGLEDSGEISCWGSDDFGESVPPAGAFSALAAGKRHNCALRADGEAVCWGWDKGGRSTPPPDARFIAIAAGGAHSCGIAHLGNLICWGSTGGGQAEPREGPFSALALGDGHTCALRPGGEAFCQGNDDYGQSSPPPATVFSLIAAGEKQSCGIAPEGELKCWGLISISDHPEKFAAVSAGYRKVCALTVAGAVKCWLNSPSGGDPLGGAWLEYPIEMFPMPNAGGAAVVDLQGYIEIYPPDGGAARMALNLTERTNCCYNERGMLSAALDPDFARFPFIYIYWQTNEGVEDADNDPFEARVSRFPVADDGEIDADGELVILRLRQRRDIHFGGAIRFGADGMLYLSLGDLAEISDRSYVMDENHPALDLSTLAGKIIRIDIRGAADGKPYRVPPDNPFADAPGARPEIWAYGLRNPWRMSFAPNGDLIVADTGWLSREEVSIARRGANLGWPLFEGSLCNAEDERLCDDAGGLTFPIFEYPRGEGDCAIIGGASAPNGAYIFGDYCSGRVWALQRTAPDVWSASEILGLSNPVLAFGTDADGAVYALRALSPVSKVSE